MKTMTETKMDDAAADLGFTIKTLQCSGYVRLVAYVEGARVDSSGPVAIVETTDCTLPEARAKIINILKTK